MIGIIIIFIFIALLDSQISNLKSEAQDKLADCSSVKKAREVRKEFDEKCKNIRIKTIVLCLICNYVIAFAIYINDIDDLLEQLILLSILAPLGLSFDYFRIKRFTDRYTYHPVSDLSYFDIKYPYYALFLRGFDNDDYNPEIMLGSSNKKNKMNRLKQFKEFQMKKKIETYCCDHIVAVGMPQEVFAPIGCERVYCEPESWKQDILHLINKSLFNIVLLNDSPSCLFELEHCLQVASKTYCIVFDRDVYENLRQTYNTFSSVSSQEPFFFRLDNPAISRTYHPIIFAKQIKKDLIDLHDEKTQQLIKELEEEEDYNSIKWGCFLVLALVIVFIIYIINIIIFMILNEQIAQS